MGWEQSRRRFRLPPDWDSIRYRVLLDADHVCEIRTPGVCIGHATDVDHINRGDDHSRSNLQAACRKCHLKKSSAEGHARKRELKAQRLRPAERHPGQR